MGLKKLRQLHDHGLTGSLRRSQSQQSFNTLTPFNFLFLYEWYMLA
jgi:hypothetical protein